MDTIDDDDLARVQGGFLGMLLPMLPGLIQGISGMMNQGKDQDAAQPQTAAGPAAPSAPQPEAAQQVAAAASPGMASGRRHVSVTVGTF
ncbi:hypothetical protein BH11MYX1_BH11MYX1_24240 [soil metagenome]